MAAAKIDTLFFIASSSYNMCVSGTSLPLT
jgi:hypothetical protein